MSDEKTALGMSPNMTAVLAYVFWIVGGIVVILLEKENRFVRFHAMQSIIMSGAFFVVQMVSGFIPVIGWIIAVVIPLAYLVCWLIAIVKSAQGEYYKFPVIGDLAEKQI
ncbi:DUF4870 domain-containing protein [Phosphitispora sp. TUW77]|uniref:DUF4870 domain-containing protein n=1 Tax=Phosphitispora sp. TUW77 TaxID=3152361 RepID=UPI003AB5388D